MTAIAAGAQHTVALVAGKLTIISLPQNILTLRGTTATFSVTAVASEGAPITYQWQYNGTNLAGATGSTLVLTNLEEYQSGDYTVIVRDNRGIAQSASVTLTVANAMRTLPVGYWPGTPLTVSINVVPPPGTTVYALEDLVPTTGVPVLVPVYYNSEGVPIAWQMSGGSTNWTVGAISDGGAFESSSFKVKFGPFFDDTPRTLTYELTPPAGVTNMVIFSGTISLDGVDQTVPGDTDLDLFRLHPADNNSPADNIITINEVTAYAFAWKKGLLWTVRPNAIPIGYMTRAGVLWKGGEYYQYDASITTAPLWWVNTPPPAQILSQNLLGSTDSAPNHGQFRTTQAIATATATNAFRNMTNRYTPNVPFTVTLTVTPATNVTVYAAEEQIGPGITATNLSTSGVFDAVNKKIKWGPFFDNSPRVL